MTKRMLSAWILFMVPLTFLSAQESFLRLDSIQVINGTLVTMQDLSSNNYRNGVDTLLVSTNSNSNIRLKSILVEVDLNGNQGSWSNSDYRRMYSMKLNNRLLMYSPLREICDAEDEITIRNI